MATRIREKSAARQQNADKRAKATAKYMRISSRKVGIVLDLIRGKQVDEALAILKFTPKAASPIVEKVLNSAIANAENNLELDRDSLYVAEAYANQGPQMKRMRIVSRSMVHPYLHRTSHITVVLDTATK
ncbi:MAG: 50S ribosomal protein L22 [Christensenellales bacterium]|jgi:large subunit ribosomal protein L22